MEELLCEYCKGKISLTDVEYKWANKDFCSFACRLFYKEQVLGD